MSEPEQDKRRSVKEWNSVFSRSRVVADIPFDEEYKRSLNHREFLLEKFLGADQLPAFSSSDTTSLFYPTLELDHANYRPHMLGWIDERRVTDSEDKPTKSPEHTVLSKRDGVYKAVDLAAALQTRFTNLLTPSNEKDRRLTLVPHLSTAFALDLIHTASPTFQRFHLELCLPYLALRHSRDDHNQEESKRKLLLRMNLSLDGRTYDGMDDGGEGLGSEKGPLRYLKINASSLDLGNDHRVRLGMPTITMGHDHFRWTASAFLERQDVGSEDFDVEDHVTGDMELEAHRKILLLGYDLEAATWPGLRWSVDQAKSTSTFRGGYIRRYIKSVQGLLESLRMYVHANRHLKFAYTIFLTGAQLTCTVPIQGYDNDHGDPNTSQKSPMAGVSTTRLLQPLDFNADLDILTHPSTSLFVFSALAYGAVAMHQYSLNEPDRFQQACLIVGLVVGFWLSLPPLSEVGAQRVMPSNLALTITSALLISAFGHWLYATCFVMEKRREGDDIVQHKAECEVV